MKFNLMQTTLLRWCTSRYIRTKTLRLSELKINHERTDEVNQIVPLYKEVMSHSNNALIKDFYGKYTYLQLYNNSKRLSRQISNICGSGSSSIVAFFSSNDILTMVILWASWISGQKVLALNCDLTATQYLELIKKTKVSLIISSELNENHSKYLAFENGIALIHIDHKFLNYNFKTEKNQFSHSFFFDEVYNNNLGAMVVYSGENVNETTLLSHKQLLTKIRNTVQLWTMSKNDSILYVCPSFCSYSNEYIFNLLIPLSVGSEVNIFTPFDYKTAWHTVLGMNIPQNECPNLLIAEPKVYQQLIEEYYKMFAGDKIMVDYIRHYCVNNIRFMMTCFNSPDPKISSTWLKITGHCLKGSGYSIKYLDSNEIDLHKGSHAKTSIRLRIIDAKNKVLLELNGHQIKRIPITVIGRLMTSNSDDNFICTGEIVSYSNGVFKRIGRYGHVVQTD